MQKMRIVFPWVYYIVDSSYTIVGQVVFQINRSIYGEGRANVGMTSRNGGLDGWLKIGAQAEVTIAATQL